jgi:hypothetical protein
MNRKYYSTNEKNNYADLVTRYPNIREALEKLTEDSCFETLTREEKELLNLFGFQAIYVEEPIGNLDHLDYNPQTFLGYLYELSMIEYMKAHSCVRELYKAVNALIPLYKDIEEFREEGWPYVTVLRNKVYESDIPHHKLFPKLTKKHHDQFKRVGSMITTLSDVEFKVFWLMTYKHSGKVRVVGFKENILLVKMCKTRLGLFIK